MATLSALRTDLQTRIADKSGGSLSATPANLYLNVACEHFMSDVEPEWREYGWYITAKQFRYDLPADHIAIRTLMWYQNGRYEIPYKSPKEFQQLGLLNKEATSNPPMAFTIIDKDLYLGPAPSTTSNTSTLNGNHTNSVTTISVADGTQFQTHGGIILINSEQIAYQGVSTNDLTLAVRAQGGTTAAAHTNADTVKRMDLVATMTYAHTYMTADADTPAFPARYHRLIVFYAAHLALKQDGRDPEANQELQIYELRKAEAKRNIRRQTRERQIRFRTCY